jgi:hypothetical protein
MIDMVRGDKITPKRTGFSYSAPGGYQPSLFHNYTCYTKPRMIAPTMYFPKIFNVEEDKTFVNKR